MGGFGAKLLLVVDSPPRARGVFGLGEPKVARPSNLLDPRSQ